MNRIINEYINDANKELYVCCLQDNFVGLIGAFVKESKVIIQHLAVAEKHQKHGMGKKLIHYIQKQHKKNPIEAETDQDAVGFYKKTGFIVESLGVNLYNVERFRCVLDAH